MTNQFLGNETDIFFSEFSDLPESTPFTSYDAMPPHLPGILLFSRGNPMLFKANQSSLCQGGVDLGDEDDEMVLEVRMRKGDRDELMVSKDIRIGMVREMVFFSKEFSDVWSNMSCQDTWYPYDLSNLPWKPGYMREREYSYIEAHVAEWWNWTLSARMHTSPNWYTQT